MILRDGNFVPRDDQSDVPANHAKITCHTTGEIHYSNANARRQTFFIEPLYALSKPHTVGYFSVPRPTRLDVLDERTHQHDVSVVFELPSGEEERLNFVVDLAPSAPKTLETYGVALTYEVYSAIVRLVPNFPIRIPSDMSEHFVYGAPSVGAVNSRQVGIAEAELNFHNKVHGPNPPIFRERGGAYVVLAAVPMRVPPRLAIRFDRTDLHVDAVDLGDRAPTHKVRFWICDKGGRNKTEDFRAHIREVELSAEI
jgi:hypothetical protein